MPNSAAIVHAKVSTKPAVADASIIGGPDWNAGHVLTGLEQIDNTSDANKPVSTAQATADALVASNAATALAAEAVLARNASNLSSGTAAAARLGSGTASSITILHGDNTWGQAGFLHAKDFGAIGNNSTDDTTALQNWITACQTNNSIGFLDAGSYKTTGTLNVTTGITIIGAGRELSILRPSSTTLDCIAVNTTARTSFSNFQIQGPSSAGVATSSAGNLLSFTAPSTGFNLDSVVRDVYFLFGFNCINFIQAAVWTVDNIFIQNPINTGITIADAGSGDSGDQVLTNSLLESNALATAILQTSAGGLKMSNNKIINWAAGYNLTLSSSISTSQLLVTANNFDTVATAIQFNKGTGTVFGDVLITGNLIGGYTGFGITDDSNASWFSTLSVAGNQFVPGTAGVGIRLKNTSVFTIGTNVFNGNGVNEAINIASGCSSGEICGNSLSNTANGKIVNASTTTRVENNQGYNPVGVTAAANVGVSPATITAGASPETHYVRQSATNTATIAKGSQQIATLAGATTYYMIELAPFDTYTVTWTTTQPTFTKDVH